MKKMLWLALFITVSLPFCSESRTIRLQKIGMDGLPIFERGKPAMRTWEVPTTNQFNILAEQVMKVLIFEGTYCSVKRMAEENYVFNQIADWRDNIKVRLKSVDQGIKEDSVFYQSLSTLVSIAEYNDLASLQVFFLDLCPKSKKIIPIWNEKKKKDFEQEKYVEYLKKNPDAETFVPPSTLDLGNLNTVKGDTITVMVTFKPTAPEAKTSDLLRELEAMPPPTITWDSTQNEKGVIVKHSALLSDDSVTTLATEGRWF
jgi:hypothetical protein